MEQIAGFRNLHSISAFESFQTSSCQYLRSTIIMIQASGVIFDLASFLGHLNEFVGMQTRFIRMTQ